MLKQPKVSFNLIVVDVRNDIPICMNSPGLPLAFLAGGVDWCWAIGGKTAIEMLLNPLLRVRTAGSSGERNRRLKEFWLCQTKLSRQCLSCAAGAQHERLLSSNGNSVFCIS